MSEASEKVARQLLREAEWAQSWIGRRTRSIMFLFGFAQCRHCVHFDLEDGSKYKGIRESILPTQGKCRWQEGNVSDILNRADLKRVHRCPGLIVNQIAADTPRNRKRLFVVCVLRVERDSQPHTALLPGRTHA